MKVDAFNCLAIAPWGRSLLMLWLYASILFLLAGLVVVAAWVLSRRKAARGAQDGGAPPAAGPGATGGRTERRRAFRGLFWLLVPVSVLIAAYFVIQLYVSHQFRVLSSETEKEYAMLDPNRADHAKTLEEAIATRIENRRKTIFWATFIANVSATLGIVVGIGTVWLGIWKYSSAHERQLEDRAKEHKDRIAGELSTLWQYAVSGDYVKRAGSVAGLQDFLSDDKEEFRPRAVAALALSGRMQCVDEKTQKELSAVVLETYKRLLEENKQNDAEKVQALVKETECTIRRMRETNEILRNTLTPVIEYAMRNVETRTLVNVSWQGLRLFKADFRGAHLSGIDLRDAVLEEANFQGVDLRGARFDAACRKGATFDGADLQGANLEYADVAGASFRNAHLETALLNNVKLLDADLKGCHLANAIVNWDDVDIGLTKNWRDALFSNNQDSPDDQARGTTLRQALLRRYGDRPKGGKRVLMLMWEMEPIVSGGGWTAAYHLVKNICRKGVNLTIMVPWVEKNISKEAFGNEVELIPLGVETEMIVPSLYEGEGRAPGGPKNYGETPASEWLSTYAYTYSRSHADIVNQFTAKALKHIKSRREGDIGVIHAHDWLTFAAATQIAQEAHIPWIAHFHSIEADRRKKPARWIAMVEQRACDATDHIIVPSHVTRRRLMAYYKAPSTKITVVPNCISEQDCVAGHLVDIDQADVIFAGRPGWQKGPDHFVRIARMIQRLRPTTRFAAFGVAGGDRSPYLYGYPGGASYKTLAELIEATRDRSFARYLPPMSRRESAQFAQYLMSAAAVRIEEDKEIVLAQEKAQGSMAAVIRSLGCGCTLRSMPAWGGDDYMIIPDDDYKRDGVAGYRVTLKGFDVDAAAPEEPIRMRRFVPWAKRFEVFRNASVLIVPSRHEPFGMIVLEAMQAGVPVFVSRHAGVNEVVDSVIRINETRHFETAVKVVNLLRNCHAWQEKMQAQCTEVCAYARKQWEDALIECWRRYLDAAAPSH